MTFYEHKMRLSISVLVACLLLQIGLSTAQQDGRGSPFKNKSLYVPARFAQQINRALKIKSLSSNERKFISGLKKASTAFWIDGKDALSTKKRDGGQTLLETLKDASSIKPAPLVTLVVYNIPNRDCAAGASRGEICCAPNCDFTAGGSCSSGLNDYKKNYIDVIADQVGRFCSKVPMAFIVEPDSLPNLVTNAGNPSCGSSSTMNSYTKGIAYAVNKLKSTCPNAAIYLDAAHGGWLGWQNNADGFAKIVSTFGKTTISNLRGFATNVANFQPLGEKCSKVGVCNSGSGRNDMCCKLDGCNLISENNPGFTELNYVEVLKNAISSAIPSFKPKFVVDTARNGLNDGRENCKIWCNPRGVAIGKRPTSRTGSDIVDAFLWVKPPTESDGCTQILPSGQNCPRFDSACASAESTGSGSGEPRAPEAGEFFEYQFLSMVRNTLRKGKRDLSMKRNAFTIPTEEEGYSPQITDDDDFTEMDSAAEGGSQEDEVAKGNQTDTSSGDHSLRNANIESMLAEFFEKVGDINEFKKVLMGFHKGQNSTNFQQNL